MEEIQDTNVSWVAVWDVCVWPVVGNTLVMRMYRANSCVRVADRR